MLPKTWRCWQTSQHSSITGKVMALKVKVIEHMFTLLINVLTMHNKEKKAKDAIAFWQLLKEENDTFLCFSSDHDSGHRKPNWKIVKQRLLPQPRKMLACSLLLMVVSLLSPPFPPMGIFRLSRKHVLLTSRGLWAWYHVYPPALYSSPKTPHWQVGRSGSPGQK